MRISSTPALLRTVVVPNPGRAAVPVVGTVRHDPLPAGLVGTAIFVVAEIMLFAGLISAFFVLRAAAPAWPPPEQPRLPALLTGCNTLVLILSAWTMQRAVAAAGQLDQRRCQRALTWTAVLGSVFLAVQGLEWTRMISYGLTASSSNYGGMFYTLIGIHGVHVAAAVASLLWVRCLMNRDAQRHSLLAPLRLYWTFVVVLWPLLYALLYLA